MENTEVVAIPQAVIVTMDTNVFIKAGFDFLGDNLQRIARYCEEGFIQLVISSVVKREVETHIRNDINDITTQISSRVMKSCLASWRRKPEFSQFITMLGSDRIIEYTNKCFSEFITTTNCEIIDTHAVSIDNLLSDHFEMRPPFEPDKPCEFKDAIIVHSLRNYQHEKGKPILVVSGDAGFKKALNNDDCFTIFDTINEMFDYINRRYKAEYYIKIKGYLTTEDVAYNILRQLQNMILSADYCLDVDLYGDLKILDIHSCKYKLVTIDAIDDEMANLTMKAECRLSLAYIFFDEDNSVYDSVDHEYEYQHYGEVREVHDVGFDFSLSLHYISNPIQITQFSINDAVIELSLDDDTLIERKRIDKLPYEDEVFNEWIGFKKCRNCGCQLTDENDDGNGYCIKCSTE